MAEEYYSGCFKVNHSGCFTGYNHRCMLRAMKLGERLRSARKSANMTQGQLAEVTNIPQQTISKIERGDQATSSYSVQLALACGVRPEWLALGNGDMRDAGQERAADHNMVNECGPEYTHLKDLDDLDDLDKALIRLARETGLTERFIEIATRVMDATDELVDKE